MRKICFVTGTRADYGLLYWIMKEVNQDPDLTLQIIATAMHLSPEYGMTVNFIKKDRFHINKKVEMLLSGDTPSAIAKSMGIGTIGFADALSDLKPDILVVLGDRFEILSAVQAATILRIPIAHIHGGESTEGLIDESIRHAVTKMSHVHFTSTKLYKKRVIQMGENPDNIFISGAPGLDNIKKLKLLEKNELEKKIGFKFGKINFLVTFHPVTLFNESHTRQSVIELLKAIDFYKDAHVIFTKQNADTEGSQISKLISNFVNKKQKNRIFVDSLGQLKYLSVLKYVDVVIGNSSSGIIEVPLFKKPTINIGDRQKGRLKSPSVIDCTEYSQNIIDAINKALSTDFKMTLKNCKSVYGDGQAATRIKSVLKKIDLEKLIIKRFFDIN